jgi:hypothetical protein
LPPREDNPLEYVGVSEAVCQKRTKEITTKIEGVSTQVTGIDKKLDVHLAGLKGERRHGAKFKADLGTIIAIIGILILLGGIVWGAAKLAQPDVRTLAKIIKANE